MQITRIWKLFNISNNIVIIVRCRITFSDMIMKKMINSKSNNINKKQFAWCNVKKNSVDVFHCKKSYSFYIS